MAKVSPIDFEIADEVGACFADPLRFVLLAYPWGEPGALANHAGPDGWQCEFLDHLGVEVKRRGFDGVHAVDPLREVASSGHGIGKSTVSAWLADWIISTRPHSKGTVTSNTFPQLQSKTWAAIQYWTRLSITGHWFNIGADRITHKQHPESWFVTAQTCREENSEAFAGQHAADSTSWYLFDEASAIPDKIWEVAEGGLTDGEPMIFAWGNPTRNSGKFHRICFGSERSRWNQRIIDSRDCKFTNKALIAEWIADYGEDSDFVRVRVKGLPPTAGDLQFIDSARVYAAQRRTPQVRPDEPLLCGVDVARGGGDWNVIRFRRGMDARSIPPIKIPGEQTRDSTLLTSKLAEILAETDPSRRVARMFVDSALGGPVVNRLNQLGYDNVEEINFGSKSPDEHQANMRAYLWQHMNTWLLLGAIDSDPKLEVDLTGPGFKHNNRDQLLIESKEDMAKRGLSSTDDGDGLGLTFAVPSVRRVYGEFRDTIHLIDPAAIPDRLSRYMAVLPQATGPHAMVWLGVDKWGDMYAYRELYLANCAEAFAVKDHAEAIAVLEGAEHIWRREGQATESATIRPGSERMVLRSMALVPDAEAWRQRYARYGVPLVESATRADVADDAIREMLRVRSVQSRGGDWPRLHVSTECPALAAEMASLRAEPRAAGDTEPRLVECLRAIAGIALRHSQTTESGR